jgi:hypothetical protein
MTIKLRGKVLAPAPRGEPALTYTRQHGARRRGPRATDWPVLIKAEPLVLRAERTVWRANRTPA